jgi:tetraacyldisaccharide 4'-kinase
MRWYDPFLYPFAFIYEGVTWYRNRMFDLGKLKSTTFKIPTVVVGNLNVGGSGKTPMVEFLIELLSPRIKMATLSRGYGRKTKGFLMADRVVGPDQIGDEPYQIFNKFRNKVSVAVGEKRALAIPEIITLKPQTELILLDDAFQHRYVKADLYILLTTYQKPFFRDRIMPLGTLRESARGVERADVIIVTKCPKDISEKEKEEYLKEIGNFSSSPVIFAGIQYGQPFPIFQFNTGISQKVILLSGIADNSLFVSEATGKFQVIETITFPDHHLYKNSDIAMLRRLFEKHRDCMILTTEKDAVKLKNEAFHEYLAEIPIFALPIKINMSIRDREFLFEKITKIVRDKAYICEI